MNSENILTLNVPNIITVVIMVAIGGLVVIGLRKLAGGKKAPDVAGGPGMSAPGLA